MRLHSTLGDAIQPLTAQTVRLYTCGLTVYSQPHIGNWLGYVYWDILVRALEEQGVEVIRTQNITDVGHLTSDDDAGEDKMETGAKREGITAWDVAEKYISVAEHEGYELLGLKRPSHLVRATDYIDKQIAFAQVLETKGFTYLIPEEGLYFDTSKLDDYGKLARLDISGLEAGVRVAVGGKKNVTDFAIWKLSPKDSKRDMEWESPWGVGFPGWHLECSVIARETLGDEIDIHTGGIDHIPVHHTNEIAQTEALTGKPFSKFWLHNNHIKVDGRKISKSLGNGVTLQDILDHGYDLNAFKLMALSKHYRTEGNFSWDILDASANRLKHWRDIAVLRHQIPDTSMEDVSETEDANAWLMSAPSAILEALDNDLNTPEALMLIDATFNRLERLPLSAIDLHGLVQLLESIDRLLGIDLLHTTSDIEDDAKRLIADRQRAREANDWHASDAARDELAVRGISVRDTAHGPIWSYR
jgi:cysteinyl-tRNA synthetase